MPEVRILAPTGVIGSGFLESSFERGVSLKPHVIASDAGSTDSGPAFLGTGSPHFSREGTKRDLRLMLLGRGTGGTRKIQWKERMSRSVARRPDCAARPP